MAFQDTTSSSEFSEVQASDADNANDALNLSEGLSDSAESPPVENGNILSPDETGTAPGDHDELQGGMVEISDFANDSTPGVPNGGSSAVLEMTEIDLTDNDAPVNGSFTPGTPGQPAPEEDDVDSDPSSQDEVIGRRVSLLKIFRYADNWDVLLMVLGTLGALGMGAAPIVNFYFYGKIINAFVDNAIEEKEYEDLVASLANSTVTVSPYKDDLFDTVTKTIMYTCTIGASVLVVGYVSMTCWMWTAERQVYRIRVLFFRSIMTQHIAWFDEHHVGEMTTRITEDIMNLQNGLGDKLALFIQAVGTFFAGFALGFTTGWKLSLVTLSFVPFLALSIAFIGRTMKKMTELQLQAYSKAGGVAEEVFSAIKTVVAFGGQHREIERYASRLVDARRVGLKKGFVSGIAIGIMWLAIFLSMALAFWYGMKLQREENYSGGDIMRVFIGILLGSISLGQAGPFFELLQTARGAAAKVYDVIDLKSEIDSLSTSGKKPKDVHGTIEFRDVHFSYPLRQEVPVLRGLSLKVDEGQTVALVGSSGCGKSTIIQLMMRFYETQQGEITLDGHNIRDLNTKWLREHMSLVQQEPVLFGTTIAENIRYGQDGVTQEQIEEAAREANAHSFIVKLPDKYETQVGERGAQLSGGQKQRVAIARALISNPKILLLDEATSALDTESEALVQQSLNKVSQGRTIIVIAHRLSTVQNADLIAVLDHGQVAELGTHHQLMEKEGIYHHLVESQLDKTEDNADNECDSNVQVAVTPSRRMSIMNGPPLAILKRQRSRVSLHSAPSFTDETDLEEEVKHQPLKRIMKLNTPEWPFVLAGCVGAMIVGCINPSMGLIFSSVIGNFAERENTQHEKTSREIAGVLAAIAVIACVANLVQTYFFSRTGEDLTMRLRKLTFASIIQQEMGWFDRTQNQVGALMARLATDASLVRGAAGPQLGTVVQALTNITCALAIAFFFGWKLAFVILAFLPLLVLTGMVQGNMAARSAGKKGKTDAVEEGSRIAFEAMINIRTVASLTKEETFIQRFDDHFQKLYLANRKKAWIYGIFFSFSQSIIFFCYAASFSYGAYLVEKEEMTFVEVFRVYSVIVLAGVAVGKVSSFSPDFNKGKAAADKIFALLDRTPAIDNIGGIKPDKCLGRVEFDDLGFRYPTRLDVQVFSHLKLSLVPGQTLALVGASGCGKSTVVQLLERFYDATAGRLTMDGTDLRSLDLDWLRSQFGLVSQEPVLFDTSISENIAYGDNSREVPMEEIVEAARKANIHNFIDSLPLKYDTNVGEKGTQLSGGQKQRVAIARALLRNPRILLLDEATSALDAESEMIVQEALDNAREGRTSIVIAHRLSTVHNADSIAVVQNGAIVEQGTHTELLQRRGQYYNLHHTQASNRQTTFC